ncbi:endonuclease domain-containing protein [uncultured Novosphingobium sp.]|uniref:endonuclease domain-containing protein n=1 Tax=uncultured Novosphingobium sp. TaxID=292277 RepID=UPI00374A7C76
MDYHDKGYSRPTARSRELRRDATEAERRLWLAISARKLAGVPFNRQFPIGPFICDFVSREYRLVIEVDGGHHAHAVDDDQKRTRFLEKQGYTVIRFWNAEVMDSLNGVLNRIAHVFSDTPSPNPSRSREGSLWGPKASRGQAPPC